MKYLILIISFLLDGILSFLLNNNIIFNSLFTLISLIIIFKYYNKIDDLKYLITCFIVGLLFDIVYTDTLFLNAGIYLIIGIIIIKFFKIFSYNRINSLLITFFVICLYRFFSFIVLANINVIDLNFYKLFESIYSSIILNFIYISCFFKRKKYNKYLDT